MIRPSGCGAEGDTMDEQGQAGEDAQPIEGRQTVDHVLRTVQQNTLQLSAMADQKASVVLGAAF